MDPEERQEILNRQSKMLNMQSAMTDMDIGSGYVRDSYFLVVGDCCLIFSPLTAAQVIETFGRLKQ